MKDHQIKSFADALRNSRDPYEHKIRRWFDTNPVQSVTGLSYSQVRNLSEFLHEHQIVSSNFIDFYYYQAIEKYQLWYF